MLNKKINILCTRPLEDSLIKEANISGISVDVISFIETKKIESECVTEEIKKLSKKKLTVVFTSMNAVEAVVQELHGFKPDWSIFCIGTTTVKRVNQYFGDPSVAGTASDAEKLAKLIVDDRFIENVVFFCGNIRRDELPDILRQNDIEVKEITVYETNAVPNKINNQYQGILFFSPSAVESSFLNNIINEQTILFAIGKTTATKIKKNSTNKIIISDEPGKENLLKKMIEYFKMSDVWM